MNPWKPWFIYRPWQIVRRLTFRPTSAYRHLPVAWGTSLVALDDEHIGLCLGTTGIYDLAVSELLLRLIRPGDLVIDVGANIGYMSALARAAGAQVMAFEPNPDLLPILRQNVGSEVDVRPVALGAQKADAALVRPDPAAHNNGLGHLGNPDDPRAVPVRVDTLDAVLEGRSVALLKLDVEGMEEAVLEGAATALEARRVRHVVFEDHRGGNSAVMNRLEGYGYSIYSIGWTLTRPVLGDRRQPHAHVSYEAPSYVATQVPQAVIAACEPRGWRALRARRPSSAPIETATRRK